MNDRASKDPGRAGREAPARVAAAITMVAYGLLVLTAAAVGVRRTADLPTFPAWSVVHAAVVMALAIGLLHKRPWAWWGTLLLAPTALLALVPVVMAVLGGPGIALLVPRSDLVLVCMEAAALILVLLLLKRIRRAA